LAKEEAAGAQSSGAQRPELPVQLWPLVSRAEGVWGLRVSRMVPVQQQRPVESVRVAPVRQRRPVQSRRLVQAQVPQALAPLVFRAHPCARVRELRATFPWIVRR